MLPFTAVFLKAKLSSTLSKRSLGTSQPYCYIFLRKKGALKKRPAYDFIEIYCLGLTYMMINNIFLPTPKEYDELTQKVINSLDLAFGGH